MRDEITPLILTYNEAPNIGRALAQLGWARRIVIVDSHSDDETEALCRARPQVEFLTRRFDDHTAQWNYGLDQVPTEWVLALDADYILPDAFADELGRWAPTPGVDAYLARFRYCVAGRPLRASLYPPRAVLFRRSACRYAADGHTQQLTFAGPAGRLHTAIDHDDRKPLARWLWAQDRYARLEASKLLTTPAERLALVDRVRRLIVPAPFLVGLYTLIVQGVILEGLPGWYYAGQRTMAEMILSLRLIERRLEARRSPPAAD